MKNKNYGLATVVGSSDNFKLLVEYEYGYISKKDEAVYFEKAKDIITGEKLYRSGYVSIWNQKDYWNNVNKAIELGLASRKKLIPNSIKYISPKEMKNFLSNITCDDIAEYYYNINVAKDNYLKMINSNIKEKKVRRTIQKEVKIKKKNIK